MTPTARLRTVGLAAALMAVPIIATGCGSSDPASTADATTRAAATTCPEVPDAVATPLTVRNTSGRDVTLDAEDICIVGSPPTPLFSGTANPSLLDTTVPGDGTPLDVTFKGVPDRWGPVDLTWTVEGRTTRLPWSIRVGFGATDNAGEVLGWYERYEKYVEGDDLESVTLADGTRVVVGVRNSTITFTKQ